MSAADAYPASRLAHVPWAKTVPADAYQSRLTAPASHSPYSAYDDGGSTPARGSALVV